MIIRPMTTSDIDTVHEIGLKEDNFRVSDSEASGFWSKDQLKRWVESGNDVLLVAEVENQIVGFVLTTHHRPTGKVTWENHLVLPKYQGQGIGKALAREVVHCIKADGATYLHFLVKTTNRNSQYYEKLGFNKGKDFSWFEMYL